MKEGNGKFAVLHVTELYLFYQNSSVKVLNSRIFHMLYKQNSYWMCNTYC